MCGRFTLVKNKKVLKQYLNENFEIDYLPNDILIPNYNIRPTNNILVIINEKNTYEGALFKWSYKPKTWLEAPLIINIQKESLFTKNIYHNELKKSRCLIVADSFYEWDKEGNPYRIHFKDKLFCMAGLSSSVLDENGDLIHTVAIITTPSSDNFSNIHSRMPLILEEENFKSWLDENLSFGELAQILDNYEANFDIYPVSKLVNNYKNNDERLIKEIKENITLFDL